jgi:formylglycine-generating enzyme required for sulfatase activity
MFTGEIMMSHPGNNHDKVFGQDAELGGKVERLPRQPSPPMRSVQPVGENPDTANPGTTKSLNRQPASNSFLEGNVRLVEQEAMFARHEYHQDQNSRLRHYFPILILTAIVAIGAYWVGTNRAIFFPQMSPASSPLPKDDPLASGPSETPVVEAKNPRARDESNNNKSLLPASEPPATERGEPAPTTAATTTSRNLDHLFDRLARLDLEFSHLKVELSELKNVQELKAIQSLKKDALTKAISTGQLFLRASADPKSENAIPMVYVSAGRFLIGQTEQQRIASARASASAHFDFSTPAHLVSVETGYFIGVYEVTFGQLAEFATQRTSEEVTSTPLPHPSEKDRNLPATSIDWPTAMNFCDWLSRLNGGMTVRLPTEVEWEYAARGNIFVQQFESMQEPNVVLGGPWPVNDNSLDRSWSGCVAMNSNVQEWTIDPWDEKAYQRRTMTPSSSRSNEVFIYKGFNEKELRTRNEPRAVRGSSFKDVAANRELALRRFKPANAKEETLGFRIVVPVVSELNAGD